MRRPGSCLLLGDITQTPKLTKEVRGAKKMGAGARSAHDTMQHRKLKGEAGNEIGETTMMIRLTWPDEVINTLCDVGKKERTSWEMARGKRGR